MWFLFLKLAVELEGQGATLIVKKTMPSGSKVANKIVRKIKVDKQRYKEWHLDQVLKSNFDVWWRTHYHLFQDEGVKVLKSGDKIVDDPAFLYVKINTNTRIRDIYASLRKHIEAVPRHKIQSKYAVHGNSRPLMLQNRYNALVLKLKDELSDRERLDINNKHIRISDKRLSRGGYHTKNKGRTMFGLISGTKKFFGARQILLSVCDGYFVKNPNTSYLE